MGWRYHDEQDDDSCPPGAYYLRCAKLVVLKFKCASGSPGGLVKMWIAGLSAQFLIQ